MPKVRNLKAILQACLECQKRKTRCIRNDRNQSCTYCARTGKDCVFEAPPSRVALTRKNFDALQEKCNHLEALLLRVGGDSSRLDNLGSLEAELNKLPSLPDAEAESDGSDGQGSPEGHLDWSETLSGTGLKATDQVKDNGMALISAQSSGYLGINKLMRVSYVTHEG
ncbi:hypothetical protein CFAM422_006073 [Trichoderma lentiforme]|uniref:Zn(2)-C6 fungal-type domain-containing protein n=1 Tax=Trichoderma lentiforme TaxID=1567552 RepID=A0A9P5CEJ9_9HYPO|nr:hypothetical protein CFAM422_006073 [Trichoderma lentiforme]